MDLPIGALVACALAAWINERIALAGIFFCVAVAMKIPPLVIALSLLVLVVLRADQRRDLRRYAALLAPCAVVAAWLAYHAHVTGWLLSRPGRARFALTPGALVQSAVFVGRDLFGAQGRVFVVITGIVCFAYAWLRRRAALDLSLLAPLAMSVGGGYAFFVVVGEFGLRYAIFVVPALFVLALDAMRVALRSDVAFAAAVAVALALFVRDEHPAAPRTSSYVFRPDEDLAYRDMIDIGVRAAPLRAQETPRRACLRQLPRVVSADAPVRRVRRRTGPVHRVREFRSKSRRRPDASRLHPRLFTGAARVQASR
ncbi:MAG: hypothetical protein ACREJ3_01795 [Polyangiaceae bacterium]